MVQGKELVLTVAPPEDCPENHKDIRIHVHYEMYTSIPLITKWVVIDKTKEDNILSSIIVDTMKTNISFLILFFSIISLQCFLIALYVPYDPIMNGFSGAEAGPAFTNLRWFYDMTGMLYIETDLPHGVKVLWKVFYYIIIIYYIEC